MLKDTKSLGNNKAPACESRGFVHKKRGVHFDTPPLLRALGIVPKTVSIRYILRALSIYYLR